MSRPRVTTFTVPGPFGPVRGAATEDGLALLVLPRPESSSGSDFEEQLAPLVAGADTHESSRHAAASEVREYLAGERRSFTCAIDWRLVNGAFARAVLARLAEVPFGRLVTYGELAKLAGSPGAARAVGGAVGRNPLPIVVPCHRVIASDGRLGGFSAGLPNKRALLALEGHDVGGVGAGGRESEAWSRARVRMPLGEPGSTSA